MFWLVNLTSKQKDDETIFVYNLSAKSVQESKVSFDDINDDFISKHVTLRLRHKVELLIEKSNDVGKMK